MMPRITATHTAYRWEVAVLVGCVGYIDLLALRSYVAIVPFHNLTVRPKLKRAHLLFEKLMLEVIGVFFASNNHNVQFAML